MSIVSPEGNSQRLFTMGPELAGIAIASEPKALTGLRGPTFLEFSTHPFRLATVGTVNNW